MVNRILVPLDGSDAAKAVLPHAAALAHALAAELLLLQVVPSTATVERMTWPTEVPIGNRAGEEIRAGEARSYLWGVARQLREAGTPATTAVRIGDAAQEIVSTGRQLPGIMLIAMATHGRSGLPRWLLGSVAEKVLHGTPVPLLLVPIREKPTPAEVVPYRTILVPLDGSACAAQALDSAEPLARATQAELLLLTVTPSLEEIGRAGLATLWLLDRYEEQEREIAATLADQARQLAARGVSARAEVCHGSPAEEILYTCGEAHADLIVMGTHGRTGWDRFWLGSVAMGVVHNATCPVLLVRGPLCRAIPD